MNSGDAEHLPVHVATMAQSVERRLGKAEVTGSIPVVSSRKYRITTKGNRKGGLEKRPVDGFPDAA